MKSKTLLSIGDFSRLAQVSTRTLRYYDDVGLLQPTHIDSKTGYRYYRLEQMRQLHRILALKDLGFELQQIAQIIENYASPDAIREYLSDQEAELEARIQADQERLSRVRHRLEQIESESDPMTVDVVLKHANAQPALGNRMLIPTVDAVPFFAKRMFDEMYAWLRKHKITHQKDQIILYHTDEYIEQDFDMETITILEEPLSQTLQLPTETMRFFELPGFPLLATTLHTGPLQEIGKTAYQLVRWIDQNGYQFPSEHMALREIARFEEGSSMPLVELQLPIEQIHS